MVEGVQKHDLLTVMGDLNARVGNNNVGFENVIGGHGVGIRNENWEKLLDFCGLNNLLVTGTIFPHKLIHKQTWTSPGGQAKNQIDHVLMTRHHRTSVMDPQAMRGADIASDHQLMRTFKTQFSLTLRNKYDVLQDYEELEDIIEKKWRKHSMKRQKSTREMGLKPWISKES